MAVGLVAAATATTLGYWWGVVAWLQDFEKLAAWVQAVGSVSALAWAAWLYRRGILDHRQEVAQRQQNIGALVAEFSRLAAKDLQNIADYAAKAGAPFEPLTFERLKMIEEALSRLPALDAGDGGMMRDAMTARGRVLQAVRWCNQYNETLNRRSAMMGRREELAELRAELRRLAGRATRSGVKLQKRYPKAKESDL